MMLGKSQLYLEGQFLGGTKDFAKLVDSLVKGR